MNGDQQAQPSGSWQFHSDDVGDAQPVPAEAAAPKPLKPLDAPRKVSWTASEFVAHHKTLGWYGALGLVAIVLAALVFLLTRDKISTGAVLFVAAVFGIAAGHQPRVLNYNLDENGLHIGHKSYFYREFKSYAVVDEGAFSSIMLLPMQRFMPALSIYYDPADEEKIFAILSEHLPLENRGKDLLDRLMGRIHF